MSSTPVLRGTTRADLLAMPAVLLGFRPEQSCVVLALSGKTVAFCARLDLDWFVDDFDDAADRIINASSQVEDCRFVVIGFGEPDLAGLAVTELAAVVGESRVLEALVTDGQRAWTLDADLEVHEIGLHTSALEAQAVYEGVRICADRGEAVAPVEQHVPLPGAQVAEAEALVLALSQEAGMDLLAGLAESRDPLTPTEACTLAILLRDEDRLGALLTRLSITNADALWPNLAAARRVSPKDAEDNVISLLGMASWLSGRGAAQTSCLEQLARSNPRHAVGGLLDRLHQYGIPPRRWDE